MFHLFLLVHKHITHRSALITVRNFWSAARCPHLYDVDIEVSACVLSSRYAMLRLPYRNNTKYSVNAWVFRRSAFYPCPSAGGAKNET